MGKTPCTKVVASSAAARRQIFCDSVLDDGESFGISVHVKDPVSLCARLESRRQNAKEWWLPVKIQTPRVALDLLIVGRARPHARLKKDEYSSCREERAYSSMPKYRSKKNHPPPSTSRRKRRASRRHCPASLEQRERSIPLDNGWRLGDEQRSDRERDIPETVAVGQDDEPQLERGIPRYIEFVTHPQQRRRSVSAKTTAAQCGNGVATSSRRRHKRKGKLSEASDIPKFIVVNKREKSSKIRNNKDDSSTTKNSLSRVQHLSESPLKEKTAKRCKK